MINIREKIRVRIMQEALDLADRNDSEGYNSVKVMCTDVLGLLETPQRHPLTDEDWEHIDNKKGTALDTFAQGAVWAANRLKEKNT